MGKDKLGYQGCIIAVFVLMALSLDLRTQLLLTLLNVGVVLAAYLLRSHFGGRALSRTEETASGEVKLSYS